jgi:hypothetical protein
VESSEAAFSSPLLALARRGAFAGASVASAAWKIGTGIAAARFRVFGAASASGAGATADTSAVSLPAFDLLFLTARLRGDFGSIAITVKSSTPLLMYWLALAQVSLSKFFYRSHCGFDTRTSYLKIPKFNESAAGAISIASRAELLPNYGRSTANIPKLASISHAGERKHSAKGQIRSGWQTCLIPHTT